MSTEDIREVLDLIMYGDEDDVKHAMKSLVSESEEERITRMLGDSMPMNYLMKFEEYLDDHDLFLFKGWEDAKIVGKPNVGAFWATFWLWVDKDIDWRGIERLTNDKEGQNVVNRKELDGDQGFIVEIKILKRYLDAIEKRTKEKAEQLADEQLAEL